MKFVFRVVLLFWAFCLSSFANDVSSGEHLVNDSSVSSLGVQEVSSLKGVEKKVRNAAVKVMSGGGHGSGTYVKYKGFHLIITAAHVTVGEIGDPYEIQAGPGINVIGRLVYEDRNIDAAAILVAPIPGKDPMKYKPLNLKAGVGTNTVYSGYPSDLNLLTIRGSVAGYEWVSPNGPVILLHTYGWFGCSGSGIYDERGNFVGILWGVSVEMAFVPQVVEDIIWVTPSHMIDEKEILTGITNLSESSDRKTRRSLRRATRLSH